MVRPRNNNKNQRSKNKEENQEKPTAMMVKCKSCNTEARAEDIEAHVKFGCENSMKQASRVATIEISSDGKKKVFVCGVCETIPKRSFITQHDLTQHKIDKHGTQ